jgi:hypothetical protein
MAIYDCMHCTVFTNIIISAAISIWQTLFTIQNGVTSLCLALICCKTGEHFDADIYKLTGGLIAGHFLKHIITAIGLWFFLLYLQKRKPLHDS